MVNINEAIALLEALEKKALKSTQRKAMISLKDIDNIRRLLAQIKSD